MLAPASIVKSSAALRVPRKSGESRGTYAGEELSTFAESKTKVSFGLQTGKDFHVPGDAGRRNRSDFVQM
jgi:hypothetical protein